MDSENNYMKRSVLLDRENEMGNWSAKDIIALIHVWKIYHEVLRDTGRKARTHEEMTDRLQQQLKRPVPYNTQQVKRKINNLNRQYKHNKHRFGELGSKVCPWKYFKYIDSFLGKESTYDNSLPLDTNNIKQELDTTEVIVEDGLAGEVKQELCFADGKDDSCSTSKFSSADLLLRQLQSFPSNTEVLPTLPTSTSSFSPNAEDIGDAHSPVPSTLVQPVLEDVPCSAEDEEYVPQSYPKTSGKKTNKKRKRPSMEVIEEQKVNLLLELINLKKEKIKLSKEAVHRLEETNDERQTWPPAIFSKIAEAKSEIALVRSEIAGLRSDIAGVKSDISELRNGITNTRSEITKMRSENVENKSHVDLKSTVTAKLDKFETLIDKIFTKISNQDVKAQNFLSLYQNRNNSF